MQLGSKGVSTETEALSMTPMAKDRALAPMVVAACMATGSTTSAAAAFELTPDETSVEVVTGVKVKA